MFSVTDFFTVAVHEIGKVYRTVKEDNIQKLRKL